MEGLLPSAEIMADIAELAAVGFVVGFGITLAFWVGGYAVRKILDYLKGGY